MDYEKYIGVTPDFPKKGISFKDISPLLANPDAFASCIKDMSKLAEEFKPDFICGPESRAFLFGERAGNFGNADGGGEGHIDVVDLDFADLIENIKPAFIQLFKVPLFKQNDELVLVVFLQNAAQRSCPGIERTADEGKRGALLILDTLHGFGKVVEDHTRHHDRLHFQLFFQGAQLGGVLPDRDAVSLADGLRFVAADVVVYAAVGNRDRFAVVAEKPCCAERRAEIFGQLFAV